MIFLGHIGIGKRIARPWSENLPVEWLVLGTILPDLIDKPLYYGLVFITHKHGEDLGLISGTRTFGHTLLLVFFISIFAVKGSAKAKALVLGIATHLLLDFTGDLFEQGQSSLLLSALFPLLGNHFYVSPFDSVLRHLAAKLNFYTLMGEVLGGALIFQDWWVQKMINRKNAPC